MNKFKENSQISGTGNAMVRSLDGNFEKIENVVFFRKAQEILAARGCRKSMNPRVYRVQIARGHVFGRCGEKT